MTQLTTVTLEGRLGETIPTLSVPEVYPALATRPQGLTQAEAAERLQRFGPNVLREIKGKPLYLKFLANFTHLMAILLWIGGLVGFIAQMPQLGIAIWLVNLINGAFSFWQEYKAEKATEALRRLLPTYARILRDGQEQRLLAEELAPGDVMLLAEGDHISADGRLVQEAELRVDQSTLSGESHPVRKTSEAVLQNDLARTELPNLVFAGTSVTAGTGKAVVFATGMNSEFGKIAHLTQSVGEQLSPLQQEIGVVTQVVSAVAVTVGLLFFGLAIWLTGMNMAESFIFAMGMIVAFVPEGLLPTVTLALAMGVQRMVKRHALVKRLSAVETLGCTSVICTDKTGTLTQNEMTVRDLWLPSSNSFPPRQEPGRWLTVTGVGYAPAGQILAAGQPVLNPVDSDLHQLLLAAGLCNDARLLPPNGESTRWAILGDPTEAALQVAVLKAGLDLEAEARRSPRLRELPFESRRKCMSTIHLLKDEGGRRKDEDFLFHPSAFIPHPSRVAYVKGAPKEVLALCSHVRLDSQDCPLTDELRARIISANDDYARNGLRVLAVALHALPDDLAEYTPATVECDLTFLGLAAMMDPPRPEVAEAVEKCHHAGIRIVMITGDYGLTAETIARRIGIVHSAQPRIVTGVELETMTDESLKEALRDEVIFARVAPEHKLQVVSALQELGQVVAVTGDGVNDAPALKKADIGVAMGLTGTDVAKEAADMILTDDNFASIVNAVEEGRAVYVNIKKFTTYIFNLMQILSIDLGTDIVPALALGTEPPEPGVMDRPPRSLKEHIITWPLLLRAYGWLGLIQSVAAMAAFYFMYWTNGYWGQWLDLPASGPLYRAATAMTLAAVVTTQIGNLFAQRTERMSVFHLGLFTNRLVWVGIASELALIFLIVYVPLFQRVFGTAAFPLENWLFLFAWAPALLLADELRKAMLRRMEAKGRESKDG